MPYIPPILSFSAFVLWLLAIAMDGPLLAVSGVPEATRFFLPAHILILGIIGFFCPTRLFNRLSPIFCGITVLLTLALPLAAAPAIPYLLILLGASGAFITITASTSLRQSPSPIVSAACGLVIANALLLPLYFRADGDFFEFALIAAFLCAVPAIARRVPEIPAAPGNVGRWHYLAFIFLFQVVGGLMYGFLMPAYQPAAYMAGVELPFYMIAVLAAYWVVRKNIELALVCGVILGMTAFALLQNPDVRLSVNMSMYAMQAGAGFIDIVLLALLLEMPNLIRAFGIGLGTVCLGIFTGEVIASSFANIAEPIALTGHMVLNVSILSLYFLGRFHFDRRPVAATAAAPATIPMEEMPPAAIAIPPIMPVEAPPVDASPSDGSPAENALRMPENIRLLLSDREYLVLAATLDGKTYRETAAELDISESTVKTYMRRIYEKMGVKRKKELFEMLSRL